VRKDKALVQSNVQLKDSITLTGPYKTSGKTDVITVLTLVPSNQLSSGDFHYCGSYLLFSLHYTLQLPLSGNLLLPLWYKGRQDLFVVFGV
jgi:hypothetical protein